MKKLISLLLIVLIGINTIVVYGSPKSQEDLRQPSKTDYGTDPADKLTAFKIRVKSFPNGTIGVEIIDKQTDSNIKKRVWLITSPKIVKYDKTLVGLYPYEQFLPPGCSFKDQNVLVLDYKTLTMKVAGKYQDVFTTREGLYTQGTVTKTAMIPDILDKSGIKNYKTNNGNRNVVVIPIPKNISITTPIVCKIALISETDKGGINYTVMPLTIYNPAKTFKDMVFKKSNN